MTITTAAATTEAVAAPESSHITTTAPITTAPAPYPAPGPSTSNYPLPGTVNYTPYASLSTNGVTSPLTYPGAVSSLNYTASLSPHPLVNPGIAAPLSAPLITTGATSPLTYPGVASSYYYTAGVTSPHIPPGVVSSNYYPAPLPPQLPWNPGIVPPLSTTGVTTPLTHPGIVSNPAAPTTEATNSPLTTVPARQPHSDVKVKKAELPTFNGERPRWPEFRTIWPNLAVPAFSSKVAMALELRRCCVGSPAKELVHKVAITGEESYDLMWHELSTYYDDEAASVDAAMKKLESLRMVKEEDYRGLKSFVETVEGCYNQLISWNQVQCLTMRDVDAVSKLLPISVKTRWHERYHHHLSQAEKLHPFPTFMRFLSEQRITVSRLAEQQSTTKKSTSHSSVSRNPHSKSQSRSQPTPQPQSRPKCVMHKTPSCQHYTEDCAEFQKLTIEEKKATLRSVHACFRCFQYHRRDLCKAREPCIKCQSRRHHTLMCNPDTGTKESSKEVVKSKAHSTGAGRVIGFYAISSVPVSGTKKKAVVFKDGGSDASYITYKAANRLGAKELEKYSLEVTTTGGQETVYETSEYEIKLVTRTGKIIPIRMFGIPKITGRLARLDLTKLSELFPDYDCSSLQREREEVDILIGSNYFGVHPKRELCCAGENLSIMEGAFGMCIQGSHPDLQEESTIDSNMVSVIKATNPLVVAANTHTTSFVSHPIFSLPLGAVKTRRFISDTNLAVIVASEEESHLTIPVKESNLTVTSEEESHLTTPVEGSYLTVASEEESHLTAPVEDSDLKVASEEESHLTIPVKESNLTGTSEEESHLITPVKESNITVTSVEDSHLSTSVEDSYLTIASEDEFQESQLTSTKSESNMIQSEGAEIKKFIEGEELATKVNPRCGGCRCNKCPQPGHTYSFEEEAQLKLIQNNLKYNEEGQYWITSYPWKFDPATLPNNKHVVLACLRRLEKKLKKDEALALTYSKQIEDMIKRGVARELSPQELEAYSGPVLYISHLGVPNPNSLSTPFRIVFNSSQKFLGISMNDSLFKGPDAYMNNQLGLLLRWREEDVGIVGDVKKMYNSVHLEELEQQCHRFLWSPDLSSTTKEPKTFVITRVNMGDRPAGAIATEAMYMTADKFKTEMPEAVKLIKEGSYVDDIMGSVKSSDAARQLTSDVEKILVTGNFHIKYWNYSGMEIEDENGETHVLGVVWKPKPDTITFKLSLNFSPKRQGVHTGPDLMKEDVPAHIPEMLTKRMVLSQVMRMFDPMGLLTPFTILGKMMLRTTWGCELHWDDPLPDELQRQWVKYFIDLYNANELSYPRALRPENAEGNPILILFSDASDLAYGFVAYARWHCSDGIYRSRLIMAKSRVSPLVKRSTPQLELNAAVMSKRGREVILQEMEFNFDRILHIIDSETVLAMLHKTSTRFRLYEGVRIGEIQAATDILSWYWLSGRKNISDWLTRGRKPTELGSDSEWFSGPDFLQKPVEEWGIKSEVNNTKELPGEKKIVTSHVTESCDELIRYKDFSSYRRMLRVVAKTLNVIQKKTFLAGEGPLTPTLLEKAEKLIIQDLQKSIRKECEKIDSKGRQGGKFYRLRPVLLDGLLVVGSRLRSNPMVPENDPQYLLPQHHPATRLIMMQSHKDTVHKGRDTTVAHFRQKYWTMQATKISSSIISDCMLCRIKKPKMLKQIMGGMPETRTKPSPPFTYVAIDYFGPFNVRGDVQKRVTGKAWGVIFTDLVSRAVFIEGVFECTTSAFLLAFGKFASCRGYPRIIYSDPGSNLVGASRELAEQWKHMWTEDKDQIMSKTAEQGVEWKFSTADSPWQNGAVEALVKSAKKAICLSLQERRLSPFEFSALMYDIANVLNERPIGTLPGNDSLLSVLTPNSLLLGRSRAKNPGGWEPETAGNFLERYHLIHQICAAFWKQWVSTVAPALVTDYKWHAQSRNLEVGDVVLVVKESSIKGEYRLARVKKTFPDEKGVVRKVTIAYKNYRVGEKLVEYKGVKDQECTRSVQRLALIVPVNNS